MELDFLRMEKEIIRRNIDIRTIEDELWEDPTTDPSACVSILERTEHMSRYAALRHHVPELLHSGLESKLSADCFVVLMCFEKDSKGPANNFKLSTISAQQIESILLDAVPVQHCAGLREHIKAVSFDENFRHLQERQEVVSTQMFVQLAIDKARVASQLENFDRPVGEKKATVEDFQVWSPCVEGNAEKIDPGSIEAGGQGAKSFLACDLLQLTDSILKSSRKYLSNYQSAINNQEYRLELLETADLKAYENISTSRGYVQCHLSNLIFEQEAKDAVNRRTVYSEEILHFAMQQDCFLNHITNFVGSATCVRLALFTTAHASKVTMKKINEIAQMLASLNAEESLDVELLCFTGSFRPDTADNQVFDPISFIPLHARADFSTASELSSANTSIGSDAAVEDVDGAGLRWCKEGSSCVSEAVSSSLESVVHSLGSSDAEEIIRLLAQL